MRKSRCEGGATVTVPSMREGLVHDYKKFLQEFEEFRVRARHLFEERVCAAAGDGSLTSGEWTPAVDVYQTADRIVLTAEIAGVCREDVTIEILGSVLLLRGRRPTGRAGVADENYLRVEIPSGGFERSFTLPCAVAEERVEAALRDGVLTVTVPLRDTPHGRRIAVVAG